jgi:Tol biopolymer transport system component
LIGFSKVIILFEKIYQTFKPHLRFCRNTNPFLDFVVPETITNHLNTVSLTMPSIVPNFEYDIFISYRHNDNRSGWVTEFVNALQEELAATIKEPLTVYFDKNPHTGLLETHDVDDSLKEKLKCLIFIPIISQTYCDPKSFAWNNEFLVFLQLAGADSIGLKVKLRNGNTASRVLPIRIHELDTHDKEIIEAELGPLRAIDFTYQSAGVNRPLRPKDDETAKAISPNVYRDQINKTANAIKEIISVVKGEDGTTSFKSSGKTSSSIYSVAEPFVRKKRSIKMPGVKTFLAFAFTLILILSALLIYTNVSHSKSNAKAGNTIKTSINLPDSISMSFMAGPLRTGRRAVDISPDGKTIVYVSMDNTGTSYLNLRPIGEENVSRLPGTKGAFSPFFSPDSKWIAFFADDKLLKISVDGNVIETLTQSANPIDGVWSEDDRITWMANEGSSFNSINSQGQDSKAVKSTMRFSSRPVWLSSDEFIATNMYNETYIVSFTNGIGKLVLSNGSCQSIYNDVLFFIKGTDLFAIDFDRDKQITLGSPRLIEKGINVDAFRNAQFAISKNGTLVYANGTHVSMGRLVWRTIMGEILTLPFDPQVYGTFSLSPDGKNVAIIKRGEQSGVWNYDLSNPKNNIQLSQQGFHQVVIWPSGSDWVYYQLYQNGKSRIERREAGGRSEAQVIFGNDSLRFLSDLDKDGVILYSNAEESGFLDLNFFSTDKASIRYAFDSRKDVNETLAKIIPEDWIAFTSDQTGRSEVFISDLLNPSVRIQVSFEGGEEPRYNTADSNLYYRNGNKLMAIPLVFDATRKSSLGASRIVFEDDNWVNVSGYSYDFSVDGKQFLLIRGERKMGTKEIKVLQNFIE